MVAFTIYSDFGAQEKNVCHFFHCFPIYCYEVMGLEAMILVFWMLSFKPAFSLSSFTFIRGSLVYLPFLTLKWYHLHIWGCLYFSSNCDSSSPAFRMMYSAYKLNKQGDNIQPWRIPFPILNQSIVPCPVLTAASCPAYRFLRRQVRWSAIPISWRIFQFVMIHTFKGFSLVNEPEVYVFFQ